MSKIYKLEFEIVSPIGKGFPPLDSAAMSDEAKRKLRKEMRDAETWNDLGNTLAEMGRGDDVGPLGQYPWP